MLQAKNQELIDSDAALYEQYRLTKSDDALAALVGNMEGLINKHVGKYSYKQRMPSSAFYSEGESIAANAIKRYDPNKFLERDQMPMNLGSWVDQHLVWRLSEMAANHGQLGKVQRKRYHMLTDYAYAKDNLAVDLGRTPNAAEMADQMGISPAEVGRIEKDRAINLIASGSNFENITSSSPKKKLAIEMAHFDLNNEQKLVLEYTYGMYGKEKIESTGALAQKLGWADSKVSKIKKVNENKINLYL